MRTDHYNPDDPLLVYVQSRAEVDPATVEEYAGMMADGVGFDPVEAITDGSKIYIWDGFHRGEAAKKSSQLLFVRTHPGTRQDAEWLALSANQKHGLRRSNADKQKIVKLALLHPNGTQLSDRQIAVHCGVHHSTVSRTRQEMELSGELRQIETRTVTRGDQVYEQNTANIGKQFHCRYWHCPSEGKGFPVDGETGVCKKCGAQHGETFSGMRLKPGEEERLDTERRERMATLEQEARERAAAIVAQSERTGADGRTINTANIGANQAKFASVWELERDVRAWLDSRGDTDHVAFLEAIKARTNDGKALFSGLSADIPGAYRPGDLMQACNNVLYQLKTQKWHAARARFLKTNITCFACNSPLEPYGSRTAMRCTGCGRNWNSVAEFERRQAEVETEAEADPFADLPIEELFEAIKELGGSSDDEGDLWKARQELRKRGWSLVYGNQSPQWCLSHNHYGTIPGDDLGQVMDLALQTWFRAEAGAAEQDEGADTAEIKADRSESQYDFTGLPTKEIERDLAALESAGYTDGDMAVRLRRELAERYDNEELSDLEKGLPPCPCNRGANILISASGVTCGGCGAKWTAEGWTGGHSTDDAETARQKFAYHLNRQFWDIIRPLSREQLYEIERRLDRLSEEFSPGQAVQAEAEAPEVEEQDATA